MKKKILLTVLASACALSCAVGLAACGDPDEPKKPHTAAQWTAAFSDPSTTDCYSFSETNPERTIRSLSYDKNSEYYYYSYSYKSGSGDENNYISTSESAYKIGGHYYTRDEIFGDGNNNFDNTIYEITSDQFTEKSSSSNNSFMSTAEKLLNKLKTGYDDFKAIGSSVSGDGAISSKIYEAKNISLEVSQTASLLFNLVHVYVSDANALYEIRAKFTENEEEHEYYYRNEDSDSYAEMPRTAPSRLDGNTFKLAAIMDADAQGAPSDSDGWIASVIAANSDKTITAKADGTLEGDIVIDMDGGGSLALNTMKYTENFFYAGEGDYGDVTVSNAHIQGLTEAQKVTLTGNLKHGFNYGGAGYSNAFKLTLNRDGHTFEFYFALQGAN